jgi:NAD(P)H-hydrate epimerase
MEVLTGEQMRRVDARVIDDLGVASLLLMESAGRAIAETLLIDYPNAATHGVLVLCGKGNNGGDGLVAARHLARLGVPPRVFLFAKFKELRGDAAVNLQTALGSGLAVEEVPSAAAWARVRAILGRPVLVVDALLGTGIKGGARGLVAEVIRDLNESAADLISVDLPSGLDADSPAVEGPAVGADRTYTLCRPKLPLALEPGALHAGRWRVLPIGIPDEVVAAEQPDLEWLDADAVRGLVSHRPPHAHKGTYGHLLAVAGSSGKAGAAVLVARGALRAGVGLVTVATGKSVRVEVASQQSEMMTEALPETRSGGLARTAATAAARLLADRDALALGPGLGTAAETRAAVVSLVSRRKCAAVVDADGLNAFAHGDKPALSKLNASSWPLILTPHPGEAARLLGSSTSEVQSDRLAASRTLAARTGAVVALKGHRTIVVQPDGRASFNSTGNPGMATGGTGDVLTGIVGALLARGMDAWDAARVAVYVHGSAGDRAADELGEEGIIASDLVGRVPAAMTSLGEPGEPRPW